ncbi:MAG: ABC transporter ATP-binding protein, partial [Chloroflexota bacterium]
PLSNLDAKLREQVRFEIRKLQNDQGFTAVYVTHDQSEALAMSDKIYLMHDGQIEQAGKPHELYTAPRNRFVAGFLGIANTFVADIVAEKSDGMYEVETPFGVLHATSPRPPVDKRVYMCWRPENAELLPEPNGHQNVIKLQSRESVFLGNVTDVLATLPDAPDTTYRVQLPRYAPVPSGSEFYVSLSPQDLYFLEDTV